MVDSRIIYNQPLTPSGRTESQQPAKSIKRDRDKSAIAFDQILKEKLQKQKLKFSRHAEKRMVSRKMEVSSEELEKLNKGVEKAALKGARDSLIMVNNNAFLVSVANSTVITALAAESVKENVFTNIDSAVIM